jgi:hypothetical protein
MNVPSSVTLGADAMRHKQDHVTAEPLEMNEVTFLPVLKRECTRGWPVISRITDDERAILVGIEDVLSDHRLDYMSHFAIPEDMPPLRGMDPVPQFAQFGLPDLLIVADWRVVSRRQEYAVTVALTAQSRYSKMGLATATVEQTGAERERTLNETGVAATKELLGKLRAIYHSLSNHGGMRSIFRMPDGLSAPERERLEEKILAACRAVSAQTRVEIASEMTLQVQLKGEWDTSQPRPAIMDALECELAARIPSFTVRRRGILAETLCIYDCIRKPTSHTPNKHRRQTR